MQVTYSYEPLTKDVGGWWVFDPLVVGWRRTGAGPWPPDHQQEGYQDQQSQGLRSAEHSVV